MNEEELKDLWQTDRTAPAIDFAKLQSSLDGWQTKLRRKTRFDIWFQGVTSALTLIPVYFYPRLIFASLGVIAVGLWYIRELRELSEIEPPETAPLDVTKVLTAKISKMESFFRRTRFVLYVLAPLLMHAAFYGLGHYDRPPNEPEWTSLLIKSVVFTTVLYEFLAFITTEIYFKMLYTPALNELKNLLRQLNFDE